MGAATFCDRARSLPRIRPRLASFATVFHPKGVILPLGATFAPFAEFEFSRSS